MSTIMESSNSSFIDLDEWEVGASSNQTATTTATKTTNTYVPVRTTAVDVEGGKVEEAPAVQARIVNVPSLSNYDGDTVSEKTDAFIKAHGVSIIARSWCPFSKDVEDFLTEQMAVTVHVIDVDLVRDAATPGEKIFAHVKSTTGHATVPVVFIKGNYVGGCDTIKALHEKGMLENDYLSGLIQRNRTEGTNQLETAALTPVPKSSATNPFFWFPNTVNNHVVRLTGFQVCVASAICAGFYTESWAPWIAVSLLVDFLIRMTVGSFLSPLGMIGSVIAAPFEPDFRAGPPKQFASLCGVMFTTLSTVFFFVHFKDHDIVGAVWIAMLAGAAGLEGFLDFCLGCLFYGFGIQFGLIPDNVYRIYTASRQEIVDSWSYRFRNSNAPPPERIDTDPSDPIAMKYKKKSDEWTKDDFSIFRNMQVSYFGMPLSLTGLAVAFKIAAPSTFAKNVEVQRRIEVPIQWFQVIATIAACVFVAFLALYAIRLLSYPRKCWKEWDCPLRSNTFAAIPIVIMLFGFLVYDQVTYDVNRTSDGAPQMFGRVLWWIGAIPQALLTVIKLGEWISRRLELEHVHPHWMMFPVGLAAAALTAPIVEPFSQFNSNSVGNIFIARFYYSFAYLMFVVLFTITFFKVVTTHNSDDRVRHGIWIWMAAAGLVGLAQFSICWTSSPLDYQDGCVNNFSEWFFITIFLFLGYCVAALPHNAFLGREQYNMAYWFDCFSLDVLAACACLMYALTGWKVTQAIQFIALSAAGIANFAGICHFIIGVINRRGIFTPEEKWGPLSFMKLTHEAFRGNLSTMKKCLDSIHLDEKLNTEKDSLGLFAAHFNRFRILHEEHAKHEDEVIFKTFNDFFHDFAKTWNDDHADDHHIMDHFVALCNQMLDPGLPLMQRNTALDTLRAELPPFFDHFEEHMRGEEDNLQPIGRKHLSLDLMKQISRECWRITPAERWEVIIPFVVINLPRHPQRIRYLKVLLWSMPERAQQIGRIVYRNVDAVMWERLRVEIPELIPRGLPNWRRYY